MGACSGVFDVWSCNTSPTHGVTIHIWFLSPSVVLLQVVVLHLHPFPCPVLSHSIRKSPAWKKLQNRLVYELINIMATDSSVLFLVFGRNWISWLLPFHRPGFHIPGSLPSPRDVGFGVFLGLPTGLESSHRGFPIEPG